MVHSCSKCFQKSSGKAGQGLAVQSRATELYSADRKSDGIDMCGFAPRCIGMALHSFDKYRSGEASKGEDEKRNGRAWICPVRTG